MSISYGQNYYAEKGEKIATLPIGYYDGFRRMLAGKVEVLVNGKRCPVVGIRMHGSHNGQRKHNAMT
jgi:alanine racemase